MNAQINEIEGLEELKPLPNKLLTVELLESLEKSAGLMERRLGGGPGFVGLIPYKKLANTIIKSTSGFYSKGQTSWSNKSDAFGFILEEYGWHIEKDEILKILAVVQKPMISSDGFICLAPGSKDVGAAKKFEINVPEELKIYGVPEDVDETFAKTVSNMIGMGIEQGNNGNSLEVVPLMYIPGICIHTLDVQKTQTGTALNRKTGIVIISKYAPPLYCEEMDINNLEEVQENRLSVKVDVAIKMLKSLK